MNTEALTQLDSFTGTEHYYRHSPKLVFTDGVKHLVENAGAYWLLDIIGSYQHIARKDEMLRDMQFWNLRPYPKQIKLEPFTIGAVLVSADKLPKNGPHIKTKGGILKRLRPSEDGTPMAYVTCDRDSDDTAIVQDILFTDFPFDTLPEIRLYVQRNEGDKYVVCLPSEY